MTEPNSGAITLGVVAVAVHVAGPWIGPYLVILLAAMCGALWAVWRDMDMTKQQGVRYVITATVAATLLTATVARFAVEYVPVLRLDDMVPIVALCLAAFGDKLMPKLRDLLNRFFDKGQS